MNSGRSALFRLGATALAILVVFFGLAAILGGLGRTAQPPILDGRLIGEIGARLPVTLEPVLISFFVASALGFVLTLSSAPALRAAVSIVVTGLQSLPIFAFAIVVQMLFLFYVRLPIGPCVAPCTFGRYLAFLALPVVILTTYQLPFLVNFFDRGRALGQDARVDEISTVRGLAMLFADRLPSLVSAAMVGEIIYPWPGEGRWLATPDPVFGREAPVFALFLIFNALVVLVVRCIIELLVQGRGAVADAAE